ncbi:MAG: M14 family zinc carboxypeptidase [Saprospiraceae bacterium]
MMKIFFIFALVIPSIALSGQDLQTVFEQNNNVTATYQECIDYYKLLDKKFKEITVTEIGPSDVGLPIHLVVVDEDGLKDPKSIRKKNKLIIWINNGIHPGEPEGIDASMIFARELVKKKETKELLKNLSFVIVPVYNVGGCLRRNNTSRTNQNGPEYYGFRGNSNNLDLNRDFVKQDSRNAKTFASGYQLWKPDIFIDNHTTDGADYPYQISLLASMRSKLNPVLGDFMYEKMIPELYEHMKEIGDEMIPYVEFEEKMEDGIFAFNDKSRYSSGYASLFHALPFIIETHMLKSFPIRVYSTLNILNTISQYTSLYKDEIIQIRSKALEESLQQLVYPLKWKINLQRMDSLQMKTFPTVIKFYPNINDSMLAYDRRKVILKSIPFYQHYINAAHAIKPKYYIIPQAYESVLENLKRNGIQYSNLESDTLIFGRYYRIEEYKSPTTPYENHFLHSQVKVIEEQLSYPFYKGDIIVSTNQENVNYILETLEPQSDDSYFAWNFFDGILMRKEYFSDYAFAPIADKELVGRPELNKSYQEYLAIDSLHSLKMDQKLNYIYQKSKFVEPYYNIYPVARIF